MNVLFTGIFLGSCLAIVGCAEDPVTRPGPELLPDQVLSRVDDLDSRPDWLVESKPFAINSALVTSLGQTEIPGDNRVDAAYRIAQNNAEAALAGAIEQKVEFIFQNAEEGTSYDANQVRFIGAEASRLVTSAIQPGKRYWEKFATSLDDGRRVTRYRVYATVEMPESDFKRAILDAVRRAQGKAGISADFADKVNQQWERLTALDRGQASAPAPQSTPQAAAAQPTSAPATEFKTLPATEQ